MAVKMLGRRSRHPVRSFSLRALVVLALAGLTGLFATNARDIARYMRMRRM
jgi:hypothetical protein